MKKYIKTVRVVKNNKILNTQREYLQTFSILEIASHLLNQEGEKLSWNKFLLDMKNRIISNYNGEEHKKYKSLWKHAYKTAAKDLKLDFDAISHEDEWKVIEEELPSPYKSQSGPSLSSKTSSNSNSNRNTSSLEYQKKLISADYIKLKEIHSKIKNKWILSSGTNVEDTIYNVSKTFNYVQ